MLKKRMYRHKSGTFTMRQGCRRLSGYDGLSVPQGYAYSQETVHKYMNTEMGLHSIVHPKKPHHRMANRTKFLKTMMYAITAQS